MLSHKAYLLRYFCLLFWEKSRVTFFLSYNFFLWSRYILYYNLYSTSPHVKIDTEPINQDNLFEMKFFYEKKNILKSCFDWVKHKSWLSIVKLYTGIDVFAFRREPVFAFCDPHKKDRRKAAYRESSGCEFWAKEKTTTCRPS